MIPHDRRMCCFSGNNSVQEVKNTRIFARLGKQGNQVLIYSMSVDARQDVAMVLPIPIKSGSVEDAVKFFDFSGYPNLFDHLSACYPAMTYAEPFGSGIPTRSRAKLQVVQVGAYDASFVPGIADFSLLDERFRLPANVWDKLPGYKDFGFAVFKLRAGVQNVHPMAFYFPTARPGHVFFPTLHIHDGEVHEVEEFDHTLYLQGEGLLMSDAWAVSSGIAVQKVKCALTHGMVRPEMHIHRRIIRGHHDNGDIVIKPRAA